MGYQWHAARRTGSGFELIGLERQDRSEAEYDAEQWLAESPGGEYILVRREVSEWEAVARMDDRKRWTD